MMADDAHEPTTPPAGDDADDDPRSVLGDDELRARRSPAGPTRGDEPVGALRDDPISALRDDPMGALRDDPMGALRDDPMGALRDDDPANDLVEGAAIAFSLGLGVVRVLAGLVEVLFPKLFLRVVGHRGTATDGAAVGFRMKGGRDLALGLGTLAAATNGDRDGVANLTVLGVVVDAIDGFAVSRDRGRSLRRPVHPAGATLGYAVAVGAGIAAAVLRRPSGPRR